MPKHKEDTFFDVCAEFPFVVLGRKGNLRSASLTHESVWVWRFTESQAKIFAALHAVGSRSLSLPLRDYISSVYMADKIRQSACLLSIAQ